MHRKQHILYGCNHLVKAHCCPLQSMQPCAVFYMCFYFCQHTCTFHPRFFLLSRQFGHNLRFQSKLNNVFCLFFFHTNYQSSALPNTLGLNDENPWNSGDCLSQLMVCQPGVIKKWYVVLISLWNSDWLSIVSTKKKKNQIEKHFKWLQVWKY